MLHWLHRLLTSYVAIRACDHGRLLALWKTLGTALGFGIYLCRQRWTWGPWIPSWRDAKLRRDAEADLHRDLRKACRLRRYAMSGDLLLHFGQSAYRVLESEIPRDAELIAAAWDQDTRQLTLYVAHPSWPEILDNSEVPWGKPTLYQRVPPGCEGVSLN